MSWDVVIMRADGIGSIDELPSDYKLPALGEANHLRGQISELFPTLDWGDPAWGHLDEGSLSIEFNFLAQGTVESFMLHVRGGGDAVSLIVAMCRHFGWQAIDVSEGDFIDLDNPSHAGWEGWQAFRDRVIKRR